jgi:hypothetical protein
MTVMPVRSRVNLFSWSFEAMKLNSNEFRLFIHAYRSLPERVLGCYGYTPEELPSDARKRAFALVARNFRAMEKWFRLLLLNETEYRIDVQSEPLRSYRPFAYSKEKFYKLAQAIEMSQLDQKRFPSVFQQCNSEGLFFVAEWQGCEGGLREVGILGDSPVVFNKSQAYKIALLMKGFHEDPRPGRLFQRNDAGKLVNTNDLKESELKPPHRYELQDSTEQILMVRETRHWNSPVSMVMQIAASITGDFYVHEAMSAFMKAEARAQRTMQYAKYRPFTTPGM